MTEEINITASVSPSWVTEADINAAIHVINLYHSNWTYSKAVLPTAIRTLITAATQRSESAENFSIKTCDDGTWFWFKSSDKTETIVNVENLADLLKAPLAKKTIKKWCEDRQTAANEKREG